MEPLKNIKLVLDLVMISIVLWELSPLLAIGPGVGALIYLRRQKHLSNPSQSDDQILPEVQED